MEFLRSWMLSVTSAALAGMLVYILAPKGGIKKAVRMVTAVFFLTAFFLPFSDFSVSDFVMPELSEDTQSMAPALEQTLENQVLTAQQNGIAQVIIDELEGRGLSTPEDIEFATDILPGEGIAITKVRIQLTERIIVPELQNALETEILKATGLEVKVSAASGP